MLGWCMRESFWSGDEEDAWFRDVGKVLLISKGFLQPTTIGEAFDWFVTVDERVCDRCSLSLFGFKIS